MEKLLPSPTRQHDTTPRKSKQDSMTGQDALMAGLEASDIQIHKPSAHQSAGKNQDQSTRHEAREQYV